MIEGDLDDIPQAAYGNMGHGLNETEEGRRGMWQAYYASVTFMDEQLGKVLDELDRQGLSDSTAIFFTTDHGYHLGEHGFWQKSNLHEEVTRVPLMIRAPGLKSWQNPSPLWNWWIFIPPVPTFLVYPQLRVLSVKVWPPS